MTFSTTTTHPTSECEHCASAARNAAIAMRYAYNALEIRNGDQYFGGSSAHAATLTYKA